MLEFLEEGHLYLLDGVLVPSVSELLHYLFSNKYLGIPDYILNDKAEYGTKIHESIEMYEDNRKVMRVAEALYVTIQAKGLNYIQEASLKQYIGIKEQYEIQVITQEEMIHYKDKYAGRFDMIAFVNNDYSLCDIKTTSELDKEYLSWQLSLYAYAYDRLNIGNNFQKLYAIWLPKKELGQVIEIDRKTDEEIEELLRKYEVYKNAIN